jgi:N-acetyl-anhydromuramyl-L-alanine amidase AmpD
VARPKERLRVFVAGLTIGVVIAIATGTLAAYTVYREAWSYSRFRHHTRPILDGVKKYWAERVDGWEAHYGSYLPWRLPRAHHASGTRAKPLSIDPVVLNIEALDTNSQWKYIVIHHTGTREGTLESVNRAHLARGWDGAGYHFLIRTGTKARPDDAGKVEISDRWTNQEGGAHAGDAEYNAYGIGICLVGDFDKATPSPAQVETLEKLVFTLQWRFGISKEHVILHRDIRKTDCPGAYFPLRAFRRSLQEGPLEAHPPHREGADPVETDTAQSTETAGVTTGTTTSNL